MENNFNSGYPNGSTNNTYISSDNEVYPNGSYPNAGCPVSGYNKPSVNSGSARTLSIMSLVLGILACITFWTKYFCTASSIMGVVGIVLSSVSLHKFLKSGNPNGRGISIAGLVTSILGTLLGGWIWGFMFMLYVFDWLN